ncbi:MAG: V-type ATP synthase subunit E [Elusimicrobiota bacterium]|nr:V-type ATP synthase subunit E [Elusimicrobiota bacterium]
MSQAKKVDNIIEGIKEFAREDIEKIISEADDKIKSLKEEFEAEKKEHIAEKKNEFKREAELQGRQIVTNKRLESRNAVLGRKREMIDAALDKLIEELRDLNKEDYGKFISSLISQVVLKGNEKIAPADSRKKLSEKDIKKILDKLNKENKWELEPAPATGRIEGGFILEGGDYETVVGWENIREYLKGEYEDKIIKELF